MQNVYKIEISQNHQILKLIKLSHQEIILARAE